MTDPANLKTNGTNPHHPLDFRSAFAEACSRPENGSSLAKAGGKKQKADDDPDEDGDGGKPDNDDDGDGDGEEPKDEKKVCPACGGTGIQKEDTGGDEDTANQGDNREKFAKLNASTESDRMLKKFCDVLGDQEGKRLFGKGTFEEALLHRIAFLSESLNSAGQEFRRQLQTKNVELSQANERIGFLNKEMLGLNAKLATFSK